MVGQTTTVRYLRIETEPNSGDTRTHRIANAILRAVLPRANPDIEHLIEQACTWWLEIEATGEPSREIGFTETGAPIVIGPVGRNHGYLVDASDDWSESTDDSPDVAANFERVWAELWPRFASLEDTT